MFKEKIHEVDLCIVGGGMAGISAAISAARRGIKVILMHDRPVLGGNASSEVRMWIRGAHGANMRETGILEEISLENIYRNPNLNYSIWDSILYEKVRFQPNIELLLNCSCCDLEMDNNSIKSIKGWQTTTQTWHKVNAKYFADCSGDSILAPLSGAEYRWGREASDEFNEDIQPLTADKKTMGLSCLLQARETDSPKSYIAPTWANKYTKEDLPFRVKLDTPKSWARDNFWWMELGGVENTIDDTEVLRDELLKVAFGVWDFIKNSGNCDSANWDLEWVAFLPGKRESRRYIGDYILTQNDVRAEGKFDDLIAYGGWSMDDHHPEGIKYPGKPTIFHPAPTPYGIPFRCLYSKNIRNLFFAGRNISATHAALSSTRVMATCSMLGQALGTAASIAVNYDLSPRGVYENKISELKQALQEDDCYLPWNSRITSLSRDTEITAENGDTSVLINGIERPIGENYNGWVGNLNSWIELNFKSEKSLKEVRIVFDSDLDRKCFKDFDQEIVTFPLKCNTFLDDNELFVPNTIVKSFKIEACDAQGNWRIVFQENNNYQRLVKIKLDIKAYKIRLIPISTWGSKQAKIFAFDAN